MYQYLQSFILLGSSILILIGCALLPSPPPTSRVDAPITRLIQSDSGRIATTNPKFAVLTFPFGNVPEAGQFLNVYRGGEKIAELKVTGPRRDINTVADIVSGEVQVNDEVRAD